MDHRDEQGNEFFHSSLSNTVSGAELQPNYWLTRLDPQYAGNGGPVADAMERILLSGNSILTLTPLR